jgi:RNA 2',3'-cyclic 3'-phosphodiesterase
MSRLFIAVQVPSDQIQKISDISDYFQSQVPPNSMKWVNPANLHITVKFLGETPKEKIEQLQTILLQSVKSLSPFELSIEGLGMYPHKRQPRTIWLSVQGSEPLISYHEQLDSALFHAGFEKDKKPLSPHLTLARVRDRTDRETAHQIGKTLSQFKVDSLGTLKVVEIKLMQSKLTPQGPIYTPLFSAHLCDV